MAHSVRDADKPSEQHQRQQRHGNIADHHPNLRCSILQGLHTRWPQPSEANVWRQFRHGRAAAWLRSRRRNAPTCWIERPSSWAISMARIPASAHVLTRRLSSSVQGRLSVAKLRNYAAIAQYTQASISSRGACLPQITQSRVRSFAGRRGASPSRRAAGVAHSSQQSGPSAGKWTDCKIIRQALPAGCCCQPPRPPAPLELQHHQQETFEWKEPSISCLI